MIDGHFAGPPGFHAGDIQSNDNYRMTFSPFTLSHAQPQSMLILCFRWLLLIASRWIYCRAGKLSMISVEFALRPQTMQFSSGESTPSSHQLPLYVVASLSATHYRHAKPGRRRDAPFSPDVYCRDRRHLRPQSMRVFIFQPFRRPASIYFIWEEGKMHNDGYVKIILHF